MRRLLPLLFAAALFSGCGRDHLQADGRYAFTTTEVLRDDCGLFKTPAELWDGTLTVAGDTVQMRYDLFEIHMAGFYLAAVERFTLDGSTANVAVDVNGTQCLLDQAAVHIEGTTVSASEFTGSIRIRYEARRPDSCICEATATFRAVQQ